MKNSISLSVLLLLVTIASAQIRKSYSSSPAKAHTPLKREMTQPATEKEIKRDVVKPFAKQDIQLVSTAGYTNMKLQLPFATQPKEYLVRKDGHNYILNDDIIVGNDYPTTKSFSTQNKDYKWINAEIPVVIDKSVFENNMQNMVISALNEMNTVLELSIIPHTTQTDYIRIQVSTTIKGSGQSAVGRQGGEQPLLLSKSAGKSTVWHELFHAAGMWHEQSRDDRDNFIRIIKENLKTGTEHNFQLEPGITKGHYDFCSIMHYPENAFSKNGQPTIECINNNAKTPCPSCMGQRTEFSPQDIKGLDQFYNEVSRFASHYKFVLPQASWRFCNKCSGMFYDGYMEKGTCAENGEHQAAGYNFELPHDIAGTATAQNSWRYCSKCFLLFYNGYSKKGVCAHGGEHTAAGYNFVLSHDIPAKSSTQASWRYCNKCYVMFFDGYTRKGKCAAGGGHTSAGYNFVIPYK